jgi:long-subunit fatty acid transport protein
MGRAFIGQADDASTAVTNPAGLVNLKDIQFYAEFKHTDLSFQRFQVPKSNLDFNTLSFLNLSVPVHSHVTVALTRHEFLKHKENLSLGQRFLDPARRFYIIPLRGRSSFQGESYAGSIGFELPANLDFGVSISANRLRPDTTLYSSLDDFQHSITGSDWAPGGTAGILYVPVEGFSIGAVYTRSPKFELGETMTRSVSKNPEEFTDVLHMRIPDRVGVGVSIRPARDFSVLFDVVNVRYSQLASPTELILGGTGVRAEDFYISNGTEFHLGTEYGIPIGGGALYLRAGFLTDPDHSLKFRDVGDQADQGSLLGFAAVFDPSGPGTNYGGSAGFGVNFGEVLQLDLAYVRMERFGELVGSLAYSFH